MPTYVHYAVTKEAGVDVLNAIEEVSVATLKEHGHDALHTYTCFVHPDTMSDIPSEVLWAGIDNQARIAVSFVDY